ncbi:MAG TPA: peptidyl-prolyl cis-trans isomerase [Conexibacter sp.]|nr:peptidyl-prolyl cis-trans isomerase [Conexibacter sp.]
MPLLVRKTLRILLALGAFFVAAITLAACGSSSNDVPGNAVASVDGTPITRADYVRWSTITARGSAQGGAVVIPDPPTYTRCIAQLRRTTRPVKGQPAPTDVTLRAQCRQQNDQLVQQTMSTLIQNVWIEKEAKDQGVSVSDADVQRQLALTKRQSFPTEAAYQRFLKQSGMTQADVEERVRIQALAQALTRKVQDSAAPVTDAQIQSYFARNRAQFAVPERRDVQLILTRTRAQADAAKAAVSGGTSWAAAAKQYSTDAASKATGGELRGVSQGQQDRAFDEAAFRAKKGVIVGPVKGQFGYYVVRVVAITPARQTPLSQARPQIRQLLQQQGQQTKMSTFVRNFQENWRGKTNCRTGFLVQLCHNAPTPRTTSTAGGTVATTPSGTSTSGK